MCHEKVKRNQNNNKIINSTPCQGVYTMKGCLDNEGKGAMGQGKQAQTLSLYCFRERGALEKRNEVCSKSLLSFGYGPRL